VFTKLEINNFQSHKHTVIDFDKNINSINGETDNGKSAVIRAIRWIVENRPVGIESSNSYWNDKYKEDMSVKLYLDNGVWIERVRNKTLNGYRYFDGNEVVTLEAIGKDVPQVVIDLLKLNDVNFQFQMDSPYLLSMTSGDASKYLNKIIHLDTIDTTLATAESDKRSLNAEKKIVEKDIVNYKKEIEKLSWLDKANTVQKRIDVYDNIISDKQSKVDTLEQSITNYEEYSTVKDVTILTNKIKEIESIEIKDTTKLEDSIKQYEECLPHHKDVSKLVDVIKEIESIEIRDISDFEKNIRNYILANRDKEKLEEEIKELKKQLPYLCPYCNRPIEYEE